MSCPSENAPLKAQLERALADDADIEFPLTYYLVPLLTILALVVAPLLYRQIWLLLFDLIAAARLARIGAHPPVGYRQHGRSADRNLSSEELPPVDHPSSAELPVSVTGLFVYPIKSCYGIEVDSAEITETGLKHDRQFVFAQLTTDIPKPGEATSESKWNFLTQRTHPALTLIRSEIWEPDPFADESLHIQPGGLLRVSFPWTPDIEFSRKGIYTFWTVVLTKLMRLDIHAQLRVYFDVPLAPSNKVITEKKLPSAPVRIHGSWPQGVDLGSLVPVPAIQQLQYFLGVTNPLTIFRMNTQHRRDVYRSAPSIDQLGYQPHTAFADSFPISIQNMNSVNDMEARVPRTSSFTPDSRRYRANIYVRGAKAYAEDDWVRIAIGSQILHVSGRITRCKLPNTNPETAEQDSRGNQPLSTMSKYRAIDAGAGPNRPCLGMMAVPAKASIGSLLLIGDRLRILKVGEHWHVVNADEKHHRPVF